MSSISGRNHTLDSQIGLPLRGRPISSITHMITDRSPITITDWIYRDLAFFKIKLVTIRAQAALVIISNFFSGLLVISSV